MYVTSILNDKNVIVHEDFEQLSYIMFNENMTFIVKSVKFNEKTGITN